MKEEKDLTNVLYKVSTNSQEDNKAVSYKLKFVILLVI